MNFGLFTFPCQFKYYTCNIPSIIQSSTNQWYNQKYNALFWQKIYIFQYTQQGACRHKSTLYIIYLSYYNIYVKYKCSYARLIIWNQDDLIQITSTLLGLARRLFLLCSFDKWIFRNVIRILPFDFIFRNVIIHIINLSPESALASRKQFQSPHICFLKIGCGPSGKFLRDLTKILCPVERYRVLSCIVSIKTTIELVSETTISEQLPTFASMQIS